MFATDGEYTSFAAVALGQFETIKDHLRALRDISEILNPDTGVVVHEVGPRRLGLVRQGHPPHRPGDGRRVRLQHGRDGQVPEHGRAVWRWTGDDAFRDEMYDFSERTCEYVVEQLDADGDGWPEGSGNVERTGMGAEKLDNAVYLIRGLYDLADMAQASRRRRTTPTWARELADDARARFEADVVVRGRAAVRRLARRPGQRARPSRSTGSASDPMEAELHVDGEAMPGLAAFDARHGRAGRARGPTATAASGPATAACSTRAAAAGRTGTGERPSSRSTPPIQAVGEGNYGRLGAGPAAALHARERRDDVRRAGARAATPRRAAGRDAGDLAVARLDADGGTAPNIDRCWTCRSMFMQAWGHYGTAWPVIHQQLGVRPDLGHGRLDVVPQVPTGQPRVQGGNIRLGDGSVDVFASHDGRRYTTVLDTSRGARSRVRIGHTLPRGRRRRGRARRRAWRRYASRVTNRGLEVRVAAVPGGATRSSSRRRSACCDPGTAARGPRGAASACESGSSASGLTTSPWRRREWRTP